MANIVTPERYSHDILRGDLERIDITIQLLRLAARKDDIEELKFLVAELSDKCEVYKKHFEEHDAEMQFVDKLVEEHKHEQIVADNFKKKWQLVVKIGQAAAVISALAGLWMLIK